MNSRNMRKRAEDKKPKERKYIVVCRKFEEASSASLPCSGQVATNSRLLAYALYYFWNKWSYKHYKSMAVMLCKRNEKGLYDAIKR